MKILGVYGGIGSPFVGAVRAGHTLVGNIEPRSFCCMFDEQGRNTFLENFPGSFLVKKFEEVPQELLQDIDIVAGHPKCGNYSQLIRLSGEERKAHHQKKSDDFLEFIRIVNLVRPKFAFFDNLPKSLEANPPSVYRELLIDYDISFEYVSNYGYGNVQKGRNRLFIIASLKELGYSFMPGEQPNHKKLIDVIGDLEGNFGCLPNHDKHNETAIASKGRRVYQEGPMTWGQVKQFFESGEKTLYYYRPDGVKKYHFGFRKGNYFKPATTLSGTNPVIHPVTNLPTSIRERARIQGFPDDFIFYGTKYEEDGTWVHNRNGNLIQQTCRCIPCEFPAFLIDQFRAFIHNDKNYQCSFQRLVKPNNIILKALGEI